MTTPLDTAPSDATDRLLQAFIHGDRAAGTALIARLAPLVLATCRRTCGADALAEDAAQETFLALLRAPQTVQGSVAAWIHRVATTRSLDLLRREARQRRRDQTAGASAPVATLEASPPEASCGVDALLEGLPESARVLLVRHVLDGISQATLAREAGCSQATISRRVAEAMATLRSRLAAAQGEDAAVAALALLQSPAPAVSPSLLGRFGRIVQAPLHAGWQVAATLLTGGAAATVVLTVGSAAHLEATVAHHADTPTAAASMLPTPPRPPAAAATPVSQALVVQARDAIVRGDTVLLARLLHDHPGLAQARVESETDHYSGYFHHATLLHHVTGNPGFGPLPVPHALESARLLLAAGAAVDARTDAGPSQPTDPGWTALGLIATAGTDMGDEVVPLIDLLVAAGADVNDAQGLPLLGAMSYGCPPAVTALLRHHARADARVAAYQDDVAALSAWFDPQGVLRPGAIGGCRYGCGPLPRTEHGRLAELLQWACMGPTDATRCATILLAHGADVRTKLDGATALHQAAFRDHQQLVRLLLAHGADPTVQDDRYHSTPAGWADYAHHPSCAALLRATASPAPSPAPSAAPSPSGF